MKVHLLLGLFAFCLSASANSVSDQSIFTTLPEDGKTNSHQNYTRHLLVLALDKTLKDYGPYKIVDTPSMNTARSIVTARTSKLENFFFRQSASTELMSELGYVPFPIDRGIVGYRVFFVSPNARQHLRDTSTIEALRQFTVGQGIGWLDTDILEYSGFKVTTGSTYEGLFNMVANNRFDLFSRGANEVLSELEAHQHIANLVLNDSITLHYPLPRFFFTNKKNTAAIERVTQGLARAYKDGSLIELWHQYYKPSIEFVKLQNRTILRIENPFLKGMDRSYEKYNYLPGIKESE